MPATTLLCVVCTQSERNKKVKSIAKGRFASLSLPPSLCCIFYPNEQTSILFFFLFLFLFFHFLHTRENKLFSFTHFFVSPFFQLFLLFGCLRECKLCDAIPSTLHWKSKKKYFGNDYSFSLNFYTKHYNFLPVCIVKNKLKIIPFSLLSLFSSFSSFLFLSLYLSLPFIWTKVRTSQTAWRRRSLCSESFTCPLRKGKKTWKKSIVLKPAFICCFVFTFSNAYILPFLAQSELLSPLFVIVNCTTSQWSNSDSQQKKGKRTKT